MDDIELVIVSDYLKKNRKYMHVHASNRALTEAGSAKFFVKANGDSELRNRGILKDREIREIKEFIKENQ